jgi:ribosomal protein S12 methylthiotransferase
LLKILTYYGLDIYKKRNLAELLENLVKVEGIEWIRLHYAFPTGFPMDVLELMKREPKICNYIDIPLQHISDSVLKSMRRGTTQEKTTSIIKRFPKNSSRHGHSNNFNCWLSRRKEEDFQILKDWVQEMKFERLGCFAYSHEENTHAYLLEDDVPSEVKQQRAAEIMDIQSQISWDLNQEKIGQTFKCIIDRKEGPYFMGRTEFDSPDVDNEVLIDASKFYVKVGDFALIKINDATEFDLYGEPI